MHSENIAPYALKQAPKDPPTAALHVTDVCKGIRYTQISTLIYVFMQAELLISAKMLDKQRKHHSLLF